jgi:dTDP-L-rhamnose 4-epimerase
VLITGGAGFIGSHTAERLLSQGHRVRLLDNLESQVHQGSRVPEYLSPDAELIVGSVCDPNVVMRALEGITHVYHFAAETGVGQSMHEVTRYFTTNVTGTAVLWEAIQAAGTRIQKFILSSSRAVYGEGSYSCSSCGVVTPPAREDTRLRAGEWEQTCPNCGASVGSIATSEPAPTQCNSVYALTKLIQEQISSLIGPQAGVPVIILRYFNVYGPRQALTNPYTGIVAGFATRMLNRRSVPLYEGGVPTRDFVHVSDVVEANVRSLTHSSDQDVIVLNVGTGRSASIAELAATLRSALGSDSEIVATSRYRRGDILSCTADISMATRTIGYRPRVLLEDGLKALVPWLQAQTPVDRSEEVETELRNAGVLRG